MQFAKTQMALMFVPVWMVLLEVVKNAKKLMNARRIHVALLLSVQTLMALMHVNANLVLLAMDTHAVTLMNV
jgi:DNA anti-recombination protein RmuC